MKSLKIIGIVALSLILIVLIMAAFAPTTQHFEREIIIQAPADFVFEHTNSLVAMDKWSPFNTDMDATLEKSFEGEDGAVGSIQLWTGDEMGKGSQEIVDIRDGEIETKLTFDMGFFKSESKAYVKVTEEGDGSKVIWGYEQESPYPWNFMNAFMDMGEMMGGIFDSGLQTLKDQVDADKTARVEFNGFTVNTTELPTRDYFGVRDSVTPANMHEFFQTSYMNLGKAIGNAGLTPSGVPCGLYFSWDETGESDIMAALPFETDPGIEGFSNLEAGGNALVIEYTGNYDELLGAHEAMDAYMKWHNIEFKGPVIEEYLTDPSMESDPAKWVTRIFYLVN